LRISPIRRAARSLTVMLVSLMMLAILLAESTPIS
jgi:hypothetical protein